MAHQMFQALPSYLGGKRRLLGAIFRNLPSPDETPVFVDPFLGGGSVSLYAKARGYRVICNDIAERSVVVGKALIENDHVTLERDDLVRLFVTNGNEPGYAETHLAPDTFPTRHARFLDTALANTRKLEGPKRWLSLLLIIKFALRLRPMGNWGAKTIIRQIEEGDYEAMNQNYVKDIFARGIPRHPKRIAEKIQKTVNRGIFSNGRENHAEQGDVFAFLSAAEGDIVYMDPPYSGTQSYERSNKPLDDLLRGRPETCEPSLFSKESPEKALTRLFEAADHIPIWVISYGNQQIGLQELIDLVRRYRPDAEGREYKHAHCTGLAGTERQQKNREFVVVGRKAQ